MVMIFRRAGVRTGVLLGSFFSLLAPACAGDSEPNEGGGASSGGGSGEDNGGSGGSAPQGGRAPTGGSSGTGNASGTGTGGSDAGAAGATDDGGAAGSGDPMSLTIEPATLPPARIGERYTVELAAVGSNADDFTWSLAGTLPPGITFEDGPGATATLEGTPTTAGTYSLRATVEDDAGLEASTTYPLRVRTLPWLLYSTRADAYAVDLSGTAPAGPVPINSPIQANEQVALVDGQPGGGLFAFHVYSVSRQDLWVANFSGSTPSGVVRVNSPFTESGARVQGVWFSPDGQRLAYAATESYDDPYRLFVTDTSGPAPGAPFEASGTLPSDGFVNGAWWGGASLFFNVYSPTSGTGATEGTRIYATQASSLPPTEPTPVTSWDANLAAPSPDGRRLAYWKRRTATAGDMYVVGVNGAEPREPVRMHAALAADESVGTYMLWAKDGSAAYLVTWNETFTDGRVLRVRFDDSGPLEDETISAGTGYIANVVLSDDGSRLVYCQQPDQTSTDANLWVVNVEGATPGEPERVNGPFVSGGGLVQLFAPFFAISPDSRQVAYLADALVDGTWEAFIVDVTAKPTTPRRLNTSLPTPASEVDWFQFSPDGSMLVLFGDLETAGRYEAFGVRLSNGVPGVPERLNGPLTNDEEGVSNLATWSPDGRFIALNVYDSTAETSRVELVRDDGSDFSPAVRVSASTHIAGSPRFLASGF
jgi:Tol biopolymer transport system component